MDTTNIIKLETNTYYDKQRKKFFFVTNLLDTLPPEIFTMTKNEDGYYTKTGKIWDYYYKNPRCFPTKEQVYLLPFFKCLKGDQWSNRWFRRDANYRNNKYSRHFIQDVTRYNYLVFVYLNVDNGDNDYCDDDNEFKAYIKYTGNMGKDERHISVLYWKHLCRGNGIKGYSNLKKKQLIKAYMLADEPLRVSRKNNRIYFENGRCIPLDLGDLS